MRQNRLVRYRWKERLSEGCLKVEEGWVVGLDVRLGCKVRRARKIEGSSSGAEEGKRQDCGTSRPRHQLFTEQSECLREACDRQIAPFLLIESYLSSRYQYERPCIVRKWTRGPLSLLHSHLADT